jgi:FlaA1/EpsC-like NDP-sugar epimerase
MHPQGTNQSAIAQPASQWQGKWRSLAVFAFDLLAVATAWFSAYLLRFNFSVPAEFEAPMWALLLALLPAEAVIFRAMGLYRGIWFFSSLPDLVRIVKAIVLSTLLLAAALPLFSMVGIIPRSIVVLYPVLLLVMMGGGRAAYRAWKEHSLYGEFSAQGKPVLVIGAGRTGATLVQVMMRSTDWRVVGLLDDDAGKLHREIMGRRVIGSIGDIAYWANRLGVRDAILAMPSESEENRQRISNLCLRAGVKIYTVPTIDQLLSGRDQLDHVRPLNLEDLLGRTPVEIDTPEIRNLLSGRVVMVTGAGGSIGSELCRQICHLDPAQLLLFENNEFALYTLHEELNERFPTIAVVPLAGDVKDATLLADVMRRYTPAVVFHAAAYKHVPLMEEHNAWQAVRNNVLGTYVVAMAAQRAQVPEFVLVSTDKAVNPTNVMGASKRLAEMVCQSLQGNQRTTRFESVRFGNVLGSTGSVIPKFQAQIRKGGPVTVTHPEITRYFMSIPEASQLVLQAAAMGEGGEVFVLDMGQPIRIADLAKQMIRLSGRREDEIQIVYSGLRPGEKLYEELLADDEHTRATHHPKVRIAKARPVADGWIDELLDWLRASAPRSDAEVRRDLRRWVPEYQPTVPPTLKPVPLTREG